MKGLIILLCVCVSAAACADQRDRAQGTTEPLFTIYDDHSTSACVHDAPDCVPANDEQKQKLRNFVEQHLRTTGECGDLVSDLLKAIDDGRVDTFGDFVRAGGEHVGGSYDTDFWDQRYSFNRAFFADSALYDPNDPWATSDQWGYTATHEGWHALGYGETFAYQNQRECYAA